MATHSLTFQAQQDLEDIWRYIVRDNLPAADRVEAALRDAFRKLAENPYSGHRRDDLTDKPVRFWTVYSYQVIYDPASSPLRIIRILSGFRDIGPVLGNELP